MKQRGLHDHRDAHGLLFVAEFAITILRQEAAAMSEHPVSRKATLLSHGPLLMPETGPARHGMYEQLQLETHHSPISCGQRSQRKTPESARSSEAKTKDY